MVPKSPKISVVIPVKNMAGKIEQCLKAVFAQSLPPYEVVVVDGRSTDGTAERAQNLHNQRPLAGLLLAGQGPAGNEPGRPAAGKPRGACG